jgi:hypothetical protein
MLGNEEAGRLAKEEAIEVPPKQFTDIPFSVGKKLIMKHFGTDIRAGGLPVLAADSPKY